jgi:simple sugar transport system ATP-binding protein
MIGKDAATLASLASERAARVPEPGEQPLLAARGIGRRGAVAPADLEIYPGEVVGFAGLLGSGRTELARLLYGADRPDSGEIRLEGRPAAVGSPVAALANRVAFSTENRRDEGIIADLTVRENLVLAVQATRGWLRPLPRKEQDALCAKYIAELGIRPADAERPIKNLSGGNQQKVLLARWLATSPRLLILDEPTRGIDVGAKAEIQEAVVALAAEGMAVVFISSEIEEVVRLSDRIVVLRDRHQVGVVANGPEVTADTVVGIIAKEGEAA